jgi:hypothetical protein
MAHWKKLILSDWSIITTVSVLLFVFWDGLVFTADTNDHVGRLIVSYTFIPTAVAGALLLRKNWSWSGFGYYTFGIAMIKMTVTMTAYMWVIPSGQRVQSKEIETVVPVVDYRRYEPMTVVDGARITGELRFHDGAAITGDWVVALLDVRRGREEDPQTHRVRVAESRIAPRLLSLSVGDTIVVANREDGLHTFALIDERGQLFQLPLPAERTAARVIVRAGFFTSRCQRGHEQERMAVCAFTHPYHAVLDELGGFSLETIPPARYQLALWRVDRALPYHDAEPDMIRTVDLKPGQVEHVIWNVDPSGQIASP